MSVEGKPVPPPLTGIRVLELAGLAPGMNFSEDAITKKAHRFKDRSLAFSLQISALLSCVSTARLPLRSLRVIN